MTGLELLLALARVVVMAAAGVVVAVVAVAAVTAVSLYVGVRGGVWLALTPSGRSTSRVLAQAAVLAALFIVGQQAGTQLTGI